MAGVITASEPSWTAPFAGLSPRRFGKLVTASWRTNLTLRQLGPLFGVSKSAAARIVGQNYWYSTNHQVVIDADTQFVVTVGRPLPGNRNDRNAWEPSGAKAAVGRAIVIADGGYRGTGLLIPHRRQPGQEERPAWKEEHNASHHKVRARVEHAMLGIARLHNLARTG
ncbi:transposase [Streptomyces sp. NPDC004539]|uniref:transposase n=1 Tax=Streptomyces sp. NPDC004539 TaxID=3154280 RepID=UPI0033BF8000